MYSRYLSSVQKCYNRALSILKLGCVHFWIIFSPNCLSLIRWKITIKKKWLIYTLLSQRYWWGHQDYGKCKYIMNRSVHNITSKLGSKVPTWLCKYHCYWPLSQTYCQDAWEIHFHKWRQYISVSLTLIIYD